LLAYLKPSQVNSCWGSTWVNSSWANMS